MRDFGCYRADHAGIDESVAVGIVERGDRHAPGALAANAPVRTVLHGRADAVLAPGGDKVDLIEAVQRALAVAALVERDEPLIHCTEDDGSLGAPAVRIAVLDLFLGDQRAIGGNDFKYANIGGGRLALNASSTERPTSSAGTRPSST